MWVVTMAAGAWATGGGSIDRGFPVGDRLDAPSDAVVFIEANDP